MAEPLTGIIRGRTIELSDDPGLVDGEAVEVVVRAIKRPEVWGDGLRRSAEHWTEEDDRILDAIYRERHRDSRTEC